MNMKISPHTLKGEVKIPPSKSYGHRALICAALCGEQSRITPFCSSVDIKTTVEALKRLGSKVEINEGGYSVKSGITPKEAVIDFCESGSTARFIMPIAAALGVSAVFTGSGRLPERPMKLLTEELRAHGVEASSDSLPIKIKGKMTSGKFCFPGNVSSQYISGVMLAAPLMEGETVIELTSPLQSVGYVDITIATMKQFGVNVEKMDSGYRIPAGQSYKKCDAVIEGDWSAAAFFMSAATLGGDIKISGLDFASNQGDMAALDVFAAFGADITLENDALHIKKGELRGIEVNAEDIPDMVPAIAATAAFAKGKTVIRGAERLRIKESDRIKTTADALRSAGVEVTETADGMIISGGGVQGGKIDGANDHRIVMAFSVLAAYSAGESIISDSNAVAKSYPEFFESFKGLEGIASEIECW